MEIECGTNIGAVRTSNQDACDCGLFTDGAVWGIICDGMGGANGGNIASQTALEEMRDFILESYYSRMGLGNIKAMLTTAVARANDAVYEASQNDESLRGMGTTAVVMLAVDNRLHVAHVGDSRAYILGPEGIERITTDHSFVQSLIDFGQITEAEARTHPKRNIITRAVGVHDIVQPDYSTVEFLPGEKILACTDGLTSYMPDGLLEDYLKEYSGKDLVEKLINYALDAGGADNITVVMINYND